MKAWIKATAERTRSDLYSIQKNFREGGVAILVIGFLVGLIVAWAT